MMAWASVVSRLALTAGCLILFASPPHLHLAGRPVVLDRVEDGLRTFRVGVSENGRLCDGGSGCGASDFSVNSLLLLLVWPREPLFASFVILLTKKWVTVTPKGLKPRSDVRALHPMRRRSRALWCYHYRNLIAGSVFGSSMQKYS